MSNDDEIIYSVIETLYVGGDVSKVTEMEMTELELDQYVMEHFGKAGYTRLWLQIGQQDSGEIEIQGRRLEAWLS